MEHIRNHYASLEDMSIAWRCYTTDDKSEVEIITLKKCGDDYYITSNHQITCVNDGVQITLIPSEHTAVYSTALPDAKVIDPMDIITPILSTAESITYIRDINGTKKYTVQSTTQNIGKFEIWIDPSVWIVKRLVQYLEPEFGSHAVFELIQFSKSCNAGPEMALASYCSVDQNGKPTLTKKYSSYELHIADDYIIRQ
jgi:hypothetical protein